jgi:hypothetical protein
VVKECGAQGQDWGWEIVQVVLGLLSQIHIASIMDAIDFVINSPAFSNRAEDLGETLLGVTSNEDVAIRIVAFKRALLD